MVIVVAEGAGTGVQDLQAVKECVTKDESGNPKMSVHIAHNSGYRSLPARLDRKILQSKRPENNPQIYRSNLHDPHSAGKQSRCPYVRAVGRRCRPWGDGRFYGFYVWSCE